MNKSLIGIAALSVMLVTGNAWSSDDAASRCQEWAKDDGVAAEEMEEYMAQCLEDQRLADAGADKQLDDEQPAGANKSND